MHATPGTHWTAWNFNLILCDNKQECKLKLLGICTHGHAHAYARNSETAYTQMPSHYREDCGKLVGDVHVTVRARA